MKDFALQLFEHVADNVLREVTALLLGDGGRLGLCEAPLEHLQTRLVIGIQLLQVLYLLLVFLPETHYLVEEHRRFLFVLYAIEMVFIKFVLEEGPHLGKFLIALCLEGFDEVG